MRPQALMLFAAGFGTRMGSLTTHQPKPMIRVAGRPLIDHAVAQTQDVALSQTVVNTHYLPEQVEEHMHGRAAISREEPDLLDTGGGLRQALPLLGHGPVFTMNTDAVWTGPTALKQLEQAWNPDAMDALLLLVPKPRAIGHKGSGDFVIAADGRLSRGQGHIYTGAQIIRTDLLHGIQQKVFSLNLLWDAMLTRGRVFGVVHQGGWCDVGSPAGIELAESMLHEENHG